MSLLFLSIGKTQCDNMVWSCSLNIAWMLILNNFLFLGPLRSPTSFLEDAMEIKPSSYEVVAVHYWLVSLLWLIMGLSMKSVKPLSLVTSKVGLKDACSYMQYFQKLFIIKYMLRICNM